MQTKIFAAFSKENVESQNVGALALGVSLLILIPGSGLCTQLSSIFEYQLCTIQMQSGLIMKIFEKTLRYPLLRTSFYKLGDLLNMVQVDSIQIVGFYQSLAKTFIIPIFLIFTMYVNYSLVGPKSVIGLIFAVVQTLLNVAIGFLYGRYQKVRDRKFEPI